MTSELWASAVEVLRENDLGGWTKPAPRLYPYQWSWDSAFIAIGLVHVDPSRAVRELETLFGAQWADGRVPHIVFNNNDETPKEDYFPDPGWWASQKFSPPAPAHTPNGKTAAPTAANGPPDAHNSRTERRQRTAKVSPHAQSTTLSRLPTPDHNRASLRRVPAAARLPTQPQT